MCEIKAERRSVRRLQEVLGKPELDGATQKSVTWAAVVAGDAPK